MKNIVMASLESLKEYENNPRHNELAIEKVAESIKEFGFTNPILIDENNVIIAGHTRFEASKLLGLNEVPCIVLSDLTQEQIKAYRLVDNKTGEFAKWDFEKLDEELKALENIDLELFGFEDFETDFISDFNDDLETVENIEEKEVKLFKCPCCGHQGIKEDFNC